MKQIYKYAGTYLPRNSFHNLQPLNQGRFIFGLPRRRGRPAAMEEAINHFLNSDVFSEGVQAALKPFKFMELVSINAFIGTSRFKITPTNAWRQFLFGRDAVRIGRPPHGERVANTALRVIGLPNPIAAAEKLVMFLVGMTITWIFTRTTPTPTGVTTLPPIDEPIEDERPGAMELSTASFSVLVQCDHDQCPDEAFLLRTELPEFVHVDQATNRLVWVCALTRAFQPCQIIDLEPANVRIHIQFQ